MMARPRCDLRRNGSYASLARAPQKDQQMIYLGIDPGVTGAIAVLGFGQDAVYDLPTRPFKGQRREIDIRELTALLISNGHEGGRTAKIGIELIQPIPLWSSVSAFAFGKSYGEILACIE